MLKSGGIVRDITNKVIIELRTVDDPTMVFKGTMEIVKSSCLTINVIRNKICDASSNSGRGCLRFSSVEI